MVARARGVGRYRFGYERVSMPSRRYRRVCSNAGALPFAHACCLDLARWCRQPRGTRVSYKGIPDSLVRAAHPPRAGGGCQMEFEKELSGMYIITIMAAQDMFTVMYTVQKKRRR